MVIEPPAQLFRWRILEIDDRILVAVSGGKDSLTLWSILLTLGYRADALYVDLGIPGYSEKFRPCHTAAETALSTVRRRRSCVER